jgi:DNA-binding winged helix-turn-helix (wHTH) protein/Tol biopolymer transport system component
MDNLHIGVFEIDLGSAELFKRGHLVKLENLPFQILVALLDRPNEVITREELCARLWPEGTHVDFEDGLNTAIRKLRYALGDSAETPIFIETIPRRGYRFIAPVVGAKSGKTSDPEKAAKNDSSSPSNEETNSTSILSGLRTGSNRGWTSAHSSKSLLAGIATLGVLALTVGWALHLLRVRARQSSLPNLQAMEIRKLTDSGNVISAAISPDGRFVVYSRRKGEAWSLRMRQVAASGDTEILPPDTHRLTAIAFSPDGNHIYFSRGDDAYPGYQNLYIMPALGGSAQLLIKDVDTAPSFSPDGRQFVFERGRPEKNIVELRIANADGSGERVVAAIPESSSDVLPGATWSPDGRTIAVGIKHQGNEFDSALYTIAVGDGARQRIYSTEGNIGRPLWLPEGHAFLIAINDRATGHGQLWFLTYPQGERQRVTNDLSDYDLDVNPTRDRKNAVTVERTINSSIWTSTNGHLASLDSLSSGAGPLLEAVETSRDTVVVRGLSDLWLNDAEKHSRTLFAKQTVEDIAACGKYVVVNAVREGTRQLLRFDADGTHPKTLVKDILYYPVCSSDGESVFYSSQNDPQRIMRGSIEGGAPKEIARNPGGDILGPLDVSHNGRFVAFVCSAEIPAKQLRFCIVPAAGGSILKSIEAAPEAGIFTAVPVTQLRWSPDDSGIDYVAPHSGTSNIWEQPISGGSPKQLTKFTNGQIFSFNWSRDGKRLLIGHGDVTSDVVLFTNLR